MAPCKKSTTNTNREAFGVTTCPRSFRGISYPLFINLLSIEYFYNFNGVLLSALFSQNFLFSEFEWKALLIGTIIKPSIKEKA